MIKANSTVKLNFPKIKALQQAQVAALEQTAEALHTKVVQDQVVPRMDGDLQGKAFSVDISKSSKGVASLVHSTPYARRLYFHPEYKFHKEPWEETVKYKDGTTSIVSHDGNPNAKGKWFEDYEPGGKYETYAVNEYKKLYGRIAGL